MTTEPGRPLRFHDAGAADWPEIWSIVAAEIATGETYAFPPDMTEGEARAAWLLDGSGRSRTWVARQDGIAVATAYLRPNQPGLGDHVANAGWMVAPAAAGRGVGRRFATFVLDEARRLGFHGMQFNAVVATNERAIALWRSLGFRIVGTVPDAFRHSSRGLTAVHVDDARL